MVSHPSDLLGQEELITHFGNLLRADKLPHALLLAGEEGGEAMHLALLLAQQILCNHLTPDGLPCGQCQSCHQMSLFQHPDLTLVFPVVKAQEGKDFTSMNMLNPFIEFINKHQRFTSREWREELKAGNKQAQIMVAEAERLIHITSLHSFSSHHQVILIWQPEAMRTETANKLLKLLEEPPKGVVFILVSHNPQALLPTIISRLQRVNVPKIPEGVLADYLVNHKGLPPTRAEEMSHTAQGNLHTALQLLSSDGVDKMQYEALRFLRLPLGRRPKPFFEEAQAYAKLDRPEVIDLLSALPSMLRETLALRYGSQEVSFIPHQLLSDALEVANAIPIDKYPQTIEEIEGAKREVLQNGHITMILFDLLLTLTQLYKK